MWCCWTWYVLLSQSEVDWNVAPYRVIVPYEQTERMNLSIQSIARWISRVNPGDTYLQP